MEKFSFEPDQWLAKRVARGGYHGKRPLIKMSWRQKKQSQSGAWSTNRFTINYGALVEMGMKEDQPTPHGIAMSLRENKVIQMAINPPPGISSWEPQKSEAKVQVIINNKALIEDVLEHLGRADGLDKNGDIFFDQKTVYNEKGTIVVELTVKEINISK